MLDKAFTNHLVNEKSPYLLQHAHNPVDWYPWGEEALNLAKQRDLPIFLSIGYSTCHWCHVMEKESFENAQVAEALNKTFVCIKVDREERPDLDAIYMAAAQAMTGHGGWPLTAFLTPDLRPFFAGTYFPPVDTPGRGVGLLTLVERVAKVWKSQRQDLEQQSQQVAQYLQQALAEGELKEKAALSQELLENALRSIEKNYDVDEGGFSPAPKFPRPMLLSFLFRASLWKAGGEAFKMAEHTLVCMAQGGIHDQIGGGFARYSTDSAWLVPHFEKMLYDNALLAQAYLEAYQLSEREEFKEVLEGILEYVQRDLRHPEGAFYSAEDADSEGQEGLFYLWSMDEVEKVLGSQDAQRFNEIFGLRRGGNFEHGKNILHLPKGRWKAEENEKVKAWKAKLLAERGKRVRPHLDDKVLVGWNGLMISAYARAGQALGRSAWVQAAAKAADFILGRCQTPQGLARRWRDGEARFLAASEDYAFFINGLVDLFEADPKPRWLKEALRLAGDMLAKFSDGQGGPLFFAQAGDASLLTRPKDGEDNAIPSGNSMAALALLRLAELSGDEGWRGAGLSILEAFSAKLKRYPMAFPHMLCALDFLLAPTKEIVVLGPLQSAATVALAQEVRKRFLPNKVLVLADPHSGEWQELQSLSSLLQGRSLLQGQATAYVCQNQSCQLPVTTTQDLAKQL